jgi:hypothetical protein
MVADLSYTSAHRLSSEEVHKVAYTVGDNGYGVVAFALGGGTQLATMKQISYIGAEF